MAALSATRLDSVALARWLRVEQRPPNGTQAQPPLHGTPSAQVLRDAAAHFGVSGAEVQRAWDQLAAPLLERGRSQGQGFSAYGARAFHGTAATGGAPAGATLGRFQHAAVSPQTTERLSKLSLQGKHAALFPPSVDVPASLTRLRASLQELPVMGRDGRVTDVHTKLMADERLAPAQKERVLKVLAEVHDSYARLDDQVPAGHADKGYQVVNWKHTRGEIDQVLEATRAAGLRPQEVEDALLASIFSDAVKAPANFITHNVDGAAATAQVMSRHLDLTVPGNLARLEGLVLAAKEHQVGPPRFMAMIVRSMLNRALGASATDADKAAVTRIHDKIADPLNKAHHTAAGNEVAFTAEERSLLGRIGVTEWTVPHEPSAHHRISRAVIDGDSLINYASPDGWAKIAAIRGPDRGPFFEDKTVFDSLASARASYDDAFSVLTETSKPLATAGLARTERSLERVRSHVDGWLARQPDVVRNKDGTVPFWNAPLRYPSAGELSPTEQKQFAFAARIRDEVVSQLRLAQGDFT